MTDSMRATPQEGKPMTQDPLLAANSNLQSLIHQVGILSEGMTDIKLMLREQADIAREQNQSIARLAETQENAARQQNEAIQRLTIAQETTFREQSAIVAAQTANVSRLIELLDRSR